jgi:TRAP-type C4-dicarboxylate transport system permease small subunit
MLKAITKWAGSLSILLGHAGGYILFSMMLLTVCDVIGRYAFNSPITGGYEVTETMMVATVFFFIPFTQTKKGHIAVDLVVILLPRKVRTAIDIVTHLMSLGILILLAYMNILRWLELMARNEHTPIIHLPVSPFVLIIAFGCFVFSIEIIKDIIRLLMHQEL